MKLRKLLWRTSVSEAEECEHQADRHKLINFFRSSPFNCLSPASLLQAFIFSTMAMNLFMRPTSWWNDVIREPILQKIAESVPYTMSLSASIFRVFLACSAIVGSFFFLLLKLLNGLLWKSECVGWWWSQPSILEATACIVSPLYWRR